MKPDYSSEGIRKMTFAAEANGVDPAQLERATVAVALATMLCGCPKRDQDVAQLNLAQAIAADRLAGDELRSITENAITISLAIARGLAAIGEFGPVALGKMRQLGAEGQLTAARVIAALSWSLDYLQRDARKVGAI